MPKGNGSSKFTKEQVKASMLKLQEKRLEKQRIEKDKLQKLEEIKEKWNREGQKWSKELEETIINNLFN